MKITCSQSELAKGINIVSKAVPTRTTMAILECILIDATSNEIKLTANDMEIGIESIIEGEIEEKGIIALDAKLFAEEVRKCPPVDVTIESDDNYKTVIRAGELSYDIVGKPGEDFSKIPVIPRNEPVIMSQFSLREVIRQTSFTINEANSNNKMMTGELIEITGDNLKAVALDTSRISIRNMKLKESYSDKKVIVPGKTLNEIAKIVTGGAEDMVEIFFTDNHIIFEFEKTTVVSRLIDGEFFKIDHMFSNDYETKIRVNKKQLLEGIDHCTPILNNSAEKKPFIMDVKDNDMNLRIAAVGNGMKDKVSIEKDGKDITIGFNPKFFIDALRVIDEEEVNLYMVNHRSPCFIRDEEDSFIYVILPVNLQE
ncbi:MAG: DNA polymerase III subunit beta [Lachnospiraceae bacterium]|nr:DNA polymerase III subunit beta [Lachnospiraceae bacterium]